MEELWAPWRMPYLKEDRSSVEGCIFCNKLDQPDVQEHILYRGETSFVLLNRYPYNNGHMMVVPYVHVSSLRALDDATVLEMMQLAREVMRILGEEDHPDGFNVGINQGSAAGAGIAEHIHLHVVPRWRDDVNYMTVIGNTRVIPEGLDDTYARLRPYFDAMVA
jgi:ATP adenylyltransferase